MIRLFVEIKKVPLRQDSTVLQPSSEFSTGRSGSYHLILLRKICISSNNWGAIIIFSGKLHHHIVALQVSEGTAVRKLEAATQKLAKQEAHLLRLEQKIDEKDQALYHAKTEARNKAKFLKRTIQDLRRQYSGALPLMKQVITNIFFCIWD